MIRTLLFLSCFTLSFSLLVDYVGDESPKLSHTPTISLNTNILEDMKTMTHDELIYTLDNITDEQLLAISSGTDGTLIPDFYILDKFGAEFIENETWYSHNVWLSGSVSSKEEANEISVTFGKSMLGYPPVNTDYSVYFIGENDLYYQFRTRRGIHVSRMIFYKDSLLYFAEGNTVQSTGSTYYSLDQGAFQIFDRNIIMQVMDIEFFFSIYDKGGFHHLYRYLDETDYEYQYIMYNTGIVFGDWNVDNVVSLYRSSIIIDKSTGQISYGDSYKIKEIPIPHTAPRLDYGG